MTWWHRDISVYHSWFRCFCPNSYSIVNFDTSLIYIISLFLFVSKGYISVFNLLPLQHWLSSLIGKSMRLRSLYRTITILQFRLITNNCYQCIDLNWNLIAYHTAVVLVVITLISYGKINYKIINSPHRCRFKSCLSHIWWTILQCEMFCFWMNVNKHEMQNICLKVITHRSLYILVCIM